MRYSSTWSITPPVPAAQQLSVRACERRYRRPPHRSADGKRLRVRRVDNVVAVRCLRDQGVRHESGELPTAHQSKTAGVLHVRTQDTEAGGSIEDRKPNLANSLAVF